MKELNETAGFKAVPCRVYYKDAFVDLRGWIKVRKWTVSSFYHQLTGQLDTADDMQMYVVYEAHHWFMTFLDNAFLQSFPYHFSLNRKRVRFGDYCAYVMSDLQGFVKARYSYSIYWQIKITGSCISFEGKAPRCHENHCNMTNNDVIVPN